MSARGPGIAIVLALLVAGAIAWWWSAEDTSTPIADAGATAPAEPAAPASAASAAPATATADIPAPAAPPEERVAAPAPSVDAAKLATIRGRCVDENGAPLADCAIAVHGWGANQERTDAWLRDHAKPEWTDRKQTTGADGTFAITFWPPPPFQFTLDLEHPARAKMAARWYTIAEGKTVDVGDVVMPLGIRLQGRVVDEAGRPMAKVQVYAQVGPEGQSSGNAEKPTPAWASFASSRDDGSFQCKTLLPFGPYHVTTNGELQLAKPVAGTLVRERPVEEITVVIKDQSTVPTITGKVVDDSGQPVRNAELDATDANHRGWSSAYTKRDGTFVLKQRDPATGPVKVTVKHKEFETLEPADTIAWGSTDVVLTLTRAGGLAVYVHDEAGRALTDFSVRVTPRESMRWSSSDSEVRARGPFEAGFAAIPGIGRGKWTVIVEFPSKEPRAPVFHPFEVVNTHALRVDLRAAADVQRRLVVVDSAGAPVADAKVQLCDPVEGEFTDTTPLLALANFWRMHGPKKALVVAAGQTDAQGTFVLTGPAGRTLGIAVLPKSHLPLRQGDVRLDVAGDLQLTVQAGATLRGRVGPPEALAELRRLAGDEDVGGAREGMPGITLSRSAPTQQRLPVRHADPTFGVAADGSFSLGGLPPGSWQVTVEYKKAHAGGASYAQVAVGTFELRAGDVTQCDPDLTGILPGTLRGTLTKNGQPVADTRFQLQGTLTGSKSPAGPAETSYEHATTDGEGRFTVQARPGTYRVCLTKQGAGHHWMRWLSEESASITVGVTTEQAFSLWTGQLAVTVRDAAGKPVADLQLYAQGADATRREDMPTTDANGAFTTELTAQTVTFRVLPKRLQSPEAQRKAWQEASAAGHRDPFAELWIPLGSATITAGQTTNVELQLPAEWEK